MPQTAHGSWIQRFYAGFKNEFIFLFPIGIGAYANFIFTFHDYLLVTYLIRSLPSRRLWVACVQTYLIVGFQTSVSMFSVIPLIINKNYSGRNARLSLMKIHTKDNNDVKLHDNEWQELADKTDGYSGSDIATLVLGALMEPIRHMQNASHWKYTPGRCCKSNLSYKIYFVFIVRECIER